MKVTGTASLSAPPDKVWAALNDPAVLVRTIPGCQRLEAVGDDQYRMTVTAGVASIKGVYQGDVSLSEQQAPGSFVLTASGAGAPGTVSARVLVSLVEGDADGTTLTYDADAIVGGIIGGVGQRMLTGVAKKTAGEFFAAVDDVLCGRAVAASAPAARSAAAGAGGTEGSAATVFEAPGAAAGSVAGSDFVRGAAIGVVATVVGALLGGWIAGRRR